MRRHQHPSGPSAWLTFVLLVSVAAMPVFSLHPGGDDPACTRTTSLAGGEGAVLAASAEAAPEEHCLVCHAMRAFRIASATTRQAGVAITQHDAPEPPRGRLHRVATDNRLPTRAPPVPQH